MPSDDPAATVRLLWRHAADLGAERSRRGPRQRFTVDDVVDSAIDLADDAGLAAVSMRSLAARLAVGTMSLYTYVSGREQLLLAMVDQVLGRTAPPRHPRTPARRLEQVARVAYDEHRQHPWLDDAAGARPGLGPHAVARFDWQLRALDGLGLDDLELDQAVTLLTGFAAHAAHVARMHAADASDVEWWETVAPTLAEVSAGTSFPLAERVGTAAGAAYQAARNPDLEFDFGLARIVEGLLMHVADRREVRRTRPRRPPGSAARPG